MKNALRVTVGVAAVLVLGWAAPHWLIGDGVDRFRDPDRRLMAGEAYDVTLQLQESPIERALIPAVRVTRVEREPGHCPPGEPGSSERLADYTATVRLHALFGIPAGTVHVTCGGWRWTRR